MADNTNAGEGTNANAGDDAGTGGGEGTNTNTNTNTNTDAGGAKPIDYTALYGSLSEENRAIFERKAWDRGGVDGKPIDINGLMDSYRSLETRVGKNLLSVPRTDNLDELNKWEGFEALGVKDKPEDYDPLIKRLDMPKDDKGNALIEYDEDGHKMILDVLATAKVPGAYAQKAYDKLVGFQMGRIAQEASARAAEDADLNRSLDADWGTARPQYEANAKAGLAFMAKEIGMDPTKLGDTVDRALGAPGMVKMFAKIHAMLGEDQLKGGQDLGFANGPEAAKAELSRLDANVQHQEALNNREHPGHAEALQTRERLLRVAHPG